MPRTVTDLIADVAESLLTELDAIGAEMDAAELLLTPALGADPAIAAEVSASNRANTQRILAGLSRRDGTYPPLDVPPEALDVVRTVVRRGVDLDVMFQAYRRGQNIAWERWMAAAAEVVPAGPELVEVLQRSSRFMFDYVDQVIARVIAEAQHEREEMLGGALARRIETVRLILDGAPIDRRRASARLDYDLDRRHTALVVWAEAGGEQVQGACESAVGTLAHAVGAARPLILPAGTTAVWAWFGGRRGPASRNAADSAGGLGEPAPGALREALGRVHPRVRVAVGPTLAGITGFRRSHADALEVQRLLAGHPDGERLAFHNELEVTALAAQDRDRAAEFVATTLGPLAADTPAAARLRETLRIYLDEAENAPRAAERLHTHRNTVLQRVTRATELLGRRPGERRLALELALELAHRIGPRVLTRP